jgi:AcrR family transcriptional regulator
MRKPKTGAAASTRSAIVEAFSRLVFAHRGDRFSVDEIVRRAGVGRSTFYEHFSGKEAVKIDALKRPMSLVADAVAGKCDEQSLFRVLEHFREFRTPARETLEGQSADRVGRMFAELLDSRIGPLGDEFSRELAIRHIASSTLELLRLWLAGRASASPTTLARHLTLSSRALRLAYGERSPQS